MDNTSFVGHQFGRYRLESLIGNGGMGQVFLSRHPFLKRPCAIKVLRPELSASPEFVDRFSAEVRLMASMSHPNIVGVHDGDRHEGLCYLVMDYVVAKDGRAESLQDRLESLPDRRLDPATGLRWAIQMVRAVDYAHAMGIVHRDLKPANVLIDERGDVKVTDFGVAKVVGNAALLDRIHATLSSQATLRAATAEATLPPPGGTASPTAAPSDMTPAQRSSSASGLVGTLAWMSPEQKEAAVTIDHRSDIYTLGMIFYRMLTGRMAGPRAKAASNTPGVPAGWDDIIDRCLEERPEERYAGAAALLADLERLDVSLRSGVKMPVAADPAGPPPLAVPPAIAPPPLAPPVVPVVAPLPKAAAPPPMPPAPVVERPAPPPRAAPAPVPVPPEPQPRMGLAAGPSVHAGGKSSWLRRRWWVILIVVLVAGGGYQAWREQAVSEVDVEEMLQQGIALRDGQGAPQDCAAARSRFEAAAGKGDSRAMVLLGLMYDQGQGVTSDYAEAMRWYQRAAEKGDSNAMCLIGTLYQLGQGVPQDFREAKIWFEKAAGRGNANAMRAIGEMYATGQGVARDVQRARMWLQKASEAGSTEAQAQLLLLPQE